MGRQVRSSACAAQAGAYRRVPTPIACCRLPCQFPTKLTRALHVHQVGLAVVLLAESGRPCGQLLLHTQTSKMTRKTDKLQAEEQQGVGKATGCTIRCLLACI